MRVCKLCISIMRFKGNCSHRTPKSPDTVGYNSMVILDLENFNCMG